MYDHCSYTTPYRWVQEYAPQLEAEHRKHRKVSGTSWWMDETYIKIKGKWVYLYRAVDTEGDTIDFLLTKKRDKKAATRFFKKAIRLNGAPEKVTIDKSGASTASLNDLNEEREKAGKPGIEIRQIKYLNNLVEQDHRGVKRRTKPMLGFQSFKTARRTLKGVELCHMIHKNQYNKTESANDWEYFYSLAGQLCPEDRSVWSIKNFATEPTILLLTFRSIFPHLPYQNSLSCFSGMRR